MRLLPTPLPMKMDLFDINHINPELPFLSYRLPGATNYCSHKQSETALQKATSLEVIEQTEGFVFAPFPSNSTELPILFFPSANHCIEHQKFKGKAAFNFFHNYPDAPTFEYDKKNYIKLVERAISTIQQGKMDKVVLSRTVPGTLPPEFDAIRCYEALCKRYPNAFVYLIHLPGKGMWMGATPEVLIDIQNHTLKIASLAGTRKKRGPSTSWPEKEQEEQRLVSEYIEKLLHEFKLKNIKKTAVNTKTAGNIEHLFQEFSANSRNLDGKLADFLGQLHPTPAIGGTPQEEAMKYILEHEKHQRNYYCGFLGPVASHKRTQLFVNLRCMHLNRKYFTLYVGGGITASSQPEEEWNETCMKSETLLNVIKNL